MYTSHAHPRSRFAYLLIQFSIVRFVRPSTHHNRRYERTRPLELWPFYCVYIFFLRSQKKKIHFEIVYSKYVKYRTCPPMLSYAFIYMCTRVCMSDNFIVELCGQL